MKDALWQARPWQAFKNFAIIFSFIMNFILLLVLLLSAPLLLPGVRTIATPLVGGLAESFVQMNEANIERTISVEDEIPVTFTLPLQQTTDVVLVEPVPLTVPATFNLPGGGGTINGTVSIQLPQGLALPVALNMQVPVSSTVPVNLEVAVDIPLQETELGAPFATLEGLFIPLDSFLKQLPGDNDELFDRLQSVEKAPASSDAVGGPPAPPE
ncbi:MAG TPA: hypothetical protein VK879_23255 [Candidatus Sulfomarinibacteraceae bacterium]|nr:hypothetical protein [Candidatus Sulfomarinibacteraceae bacterium]